MDAPKFKATIAFLSYAAQREENGTGELSITSFHAVGFSQASH